MGDGEIPKRRDRKNSENTLEKDYSRRNSMDLRHRHSSFFETNPHEIPLSSNFISDVLNCHFKLKLTVTVSHASMEVAAMDVVDSYPLQIRYDMQYSELLRLTMVYIAICSIGQILAIPVSWLLFPRSRTQEARGEPGGDLWAADAICLLLFSIALFLGLGGLG